MALYKEIRQDDGVTTKYHRILYLTHTVNSHNSIAVVSYVDEIARTDEKTAVLPNPYKKAVTYETAYNENMTVENAYEYLRTLPEFEGAEDV